jgi:hypothetical protein
VTRWPARKRPEVPTEPPAWYRVFDPEAWSDPADDGPEEWRLHRAQGRWLDAKKRWCDAHPEFDWLEDLRQQRAARRTEHGWW